MDMFPMCTSNFPRTFHQRFSPTWGTAAGPCWGSRPSLQPTCSVRDIPCVPNGVARACASEEISRLRLLKPQTREWFGAGKAMVFWDGVYNYGELGNSDIKIRFQHIRISCIIYHRLSCIITVTCSILGIRQFVEAFVREKQNHFTGERALDEVWYTGNCQMSQHITTIRMVTFKW